MLVVEICVGSSCHIHGSAFVIKTLQELIAKEKVADKIELKASFCMEDCLKGVCLTLNGEKLQNVTPTNIATIFNKEILPKVL